MSSEILISFLIYIVITIVIFLLLREVMCWYFKINHAITMQEEQIQLQKKTVDLLEKLVKSTHNHSQNENIENDHKGVIGIRPYQDVLSDDEIEVVKSKTLELKEDELIIINTVSRIIKRIHKTDFTDGKGWVIIKEFGQ
ncbi:MAG: hypothetical protein HXX14_10060 [Bacteroidetes bacterium]|nr:hypothetical protein [Bacteroidota bacterium]